MQLIITLLFLELTRSLSISFRLRKSSVFDLYKYSYPFFIVFIIYSSSCRIISYIIASARIYRVNIYNDCYRIIASIKKELTYVRWLVV